MRIVLWSLLLLLVAAFTVAFLHPAGPEGMLAMLTGDPHAQAAGSKSRTGRLDQPSLTARVESEIEKAYTAYDAGDFSLAATFYRVARAASQSPDQTRRAVAGLRKALLADVLVTGASPASAPGDAYARLRAEAEARGTESAWFDAVRACAAAGRKTDLAYVVESCLEAARADGIVQRHVVSVARNRGPAGRGLANALRSIGLHADGIAVASGRRGYAEDDGAEDDDGTGGILGPGKRRGRGSMPFGAFSNKTLKDLRRALDLEADGMVEYDRAGPDGTDRERHRRAAMKKLREAQQIYESALEEDPGSRDAERSYGRITRVIAGLRKDLTAGE